MSAVKQANGYDVTAYDTVDSTLTARRFAAELDRDNPAIDRVCAATGGDVTVWVDGNGGPNSIDAPDGWRIDRAFVSTAGNVGIRFEREA